MFGTAALRPVISALVLAMLCPTLSHAQLWGGASGYNSLVTELGGVPATEYNEVPLVGEADAAWRYRRGTSEPPAGWQAVDFTEDDTWMTGETPLGFGNGDFIPASELTDMQGNYSTIYLRHPFTVTSGAIPGRLRVRVYVDDGAIIWLNGTEVARLHVGTGFKGHDATAAEDREPSWEDVDLTGIEGLLNVGTNVLAVLALNGSLDGPAGSDFSIDTALLSPALRATHVEARAGNNYLPQASGESDPPQGFAFSGTSIFGGQTFHIQSLGAGQATPPTFARSSHARNVGNRFYSSNSLSPGLALIDNFDANGWINSDFLRSNFLFSAPLVENNIIQNHSWVAFGHAAGASEEVIDANINNYNEIVRRLDHAIDRDGFLAMVGLNNGSATSVPPVFGGAYNAISVGRTNGVHSRGGTISIGAAGTGAVDYDGPGRVKPEIVASDNATSFATPQISSAAALLLANANTRGWAAPFTSYVMKAILLAGATKDEFRTASYTWERTATRPLDPVYGAGELNVQHSYHILDAGEQTPGSICGHYGWDKASLPTAGSSTYTLQLDSDVTELSCIITWNRIIDTEIWLGGGSFSATLADMSLGFGTAAAPVSYDSSDSAIDNIEHVNLRGLRAGTYTLTVTTDVAVDFSIAWRAEVGTLPGFTMTEGTTLDDVDFSFADLAIGKGYTLESSTDLIAWSPAHTFTATATTDSYTLPAGLAAPRTFYRITWNPVN